MSLLVKRPRHWHGKHNKGNSLRTSNSIFWEVYYSWIAIANPPPTMRWTSLSDKNSFFMNYRFRVFMNFWCFYVLFLMDGLNSGVSAYTGYLMVSGCCAEPACRTGRDGAVCLSPKWIYGEQASSESLSAGGGPARPSASEAGAPNYLSPSRCIFNRAADLQLLDLYPRPSFHLTLSKSLFFH